MRSKIKVQIGDKVYTNVVLSLEQGKSDMTMTIPTEDSLGVVASCFDLDATLHAFDENDVETGVWYVHKLLSMYVSTDCLPGEEAIRTVVVVFNASAITDEAEEILNIGIEDNMDAIIELGGLIADMSETNIEINKIKGTLEGIPKDLVERFEAINHLYNQLSDRVAALENKLVD